MRVRAFAKINLSLRVLGKRSDGYHELRTVFQSIALHDTLTFRRAPGPFRLTCDDPACPAGASNLVARAAARLWKAAGRRGAARDLHVHLAKRIPVQAGLGGGSSDAAAAIRVLGRTWDVPAPRQRAIAAALGADVPYFFEGGAVLGLDRGDLLFPLADPAPAWVVLALPSFGVRAGDAFAWFDAAPGAGRSRSARLNDLEGPVVRRHPAIGRIVLGLRRAGARDAAMTGSGSTVFGLFSRRTDAAAAARAIAGPGRRVILTRTIDRDTYRRLAAK